MFWRPGLEYESNCDGNVDATLQNFFLVRQAMRLPYNWTKLENSLMKTIARCEGVRGQRNAPRPALNLLFRKRLLVVKPRTENSNLITR